MESFKELFEMVKEYTRQYVIDSHELSEIAYQVWIKSLEPVSFDGNTAVLFIKAEFMKKIVEEKFLDWQTFSPNELSPNANGETPEAAFVIMDYEGKVLALVGGKGEKAQSRSFNRATMAARFSRPGRAPPCCDPRPP